MIKPSSLKELLTGLTLRLLKVVYSVDDGCSNQEKSNPTQAKTQARTGSEIFLVSSTPPPDQKPGC